MSEINEYRRQRADQARRAAAVMSLIEGDGAFFESTQQRMDPVREVWRKSLAAYHDKHGQYPDPSILAAAHGALERLINPKKRAAIGMQSMMEAAGVSMATSAGVMTIQTWGAVILPVMLASTTLSMCSVINAESDEPFMLQMYPVAGADLADYNKGDRLDGDQVGQLASMNHFMRLPDADQPDGTKTVFTFSTATLLGSKLPIRQGTVLITADGDTRRADSRNRGADAKGFLSAFAGGDASVTFDYLNGIVTLTCTAAPAASVRLSIEFDIDSEYAPDYLPEINLHAEKRPVNVSRYQLSGEATVQAIMDLQREQGMNLNDALVAAISRWLAGESDVRRLKKALFYNHQQTTVNGLRSIGEDMMTFVRRIKNSLNELSDEMQAKNRSVGFTGCYAGVKVAQLFRAMPADEFVPDPDFERSTGIRRAGRLFGKYDVFAVSDELCTALSAASCTLGSDDALFFGSDGNGHSPMIAGDAIAPVQINHGVTPLLRQRTTIYGSEVNAVNPFGGLECMIRVHFDKI